MRRIIFLLLALSVALWAGDTVKIIKDPKPTCVETEYQNLVKVRELQESEDSEEFLVTPFSLVVDSRGHIFVYDAYQVRIFHFDPELKLVRAFLQRGQGPGEIGGNGPMYSRLFLRGQEIYLPDSMNRKVICFTTNGELKREIPYKPRGLQNMSVALDHEGHIYLHSDNNPDNPNVIDCLDSNGDFLRGYLARSKILVGLFEKFRMESKQFPGMVGNGWYGAVSEINLFFTLNQQDQLLVYSPASGQFWRFHHGKLQSAARLWPKNALEDYQKKAREISGIRNGFALFFRGLLPDGDHSERFFLSYGNFQGGDKNFLYQFDEAGNLIKVFCMPNPRGSFVQVRCKKHDRFYAVTRNQFKNLTISVYQEEKHE